MSCRLNVKPSGFTLIEIIIVIAVISILAGSMAPMISQRIEAAREDSTRIKMENLKKALLAYAKDTGQFPKEKKSGPESLAVLEDAGRKPPAGWRGPYLVGSYGKQDYARDAWNSPYRYRLEQPSRNAAPQAILTSIGSDRTRRTKDDIVLTIPMPLEDVSERIERTKARLKLIEGDIYSRGGEGAPENYKMPKQWQKDAWGNAIRYKRYNAFSAAVYSSGPNGVDDKLSKDDLYRALVWSPEDVASTSSASSRVSAPARARSGSTGKGRAIAGVPSAPETQFKSVSVGGGRVQGTSGSGGKSSAEKPLSQSLSASRQAEKGHRSEAAGVQASGSMGLNKTPGGNGEAGLSSSASSEGRGSRPGSTAASGTSLSSGEGSQKASLSGKDILKLPPNNIASVPPEQIAKMSQADFKRLSLKQKVMLTNAQLAERKRADTVRARKYYQFKDLPADQVKYLTKKQMASIPNGWWMNSLSRKQKMALSKKQIQSLNTRKVSIGTLPEEKIKHLSISQIQAIKSYRDFRYLPPDKVSSLKPKQIAKIPNGWWMNRFSATQMHQLTKAQVRAIRPSFYSRVQKRLTAEQRKWRS